MFDDADYIISNPLTHDISAINDPLPPNVERARSSRVVVLLSFWANYALGGLNVRGYHAVNLALHIGAALFLFGFLRALLRSPHVRFCASGTLKWLPLFGALLFALHPVNTIAVTYITQRFASMVTLFMLGGLWAYARWRAGGKTGFYAASLVMATLAMKTKEPAFMLPAVMGLYEFLFEAGPVGRRLRALVPFVLVAALVPLAHLMAGKDIAGAMTVNTEISRITYILTEFRVLVTYLRLYIWPVGLLIDYDFPLSHSLAEPAVLWALGVHAAVIGLGVWAALRRGALGRIVAFGAFCFYITLVVESGLVPLGDVIFEYRMYLPSAFVLPALGALVLWVTPGRVAPWIIVALALVLGGMTVARNEDWHKESTLWAQVIERYPQRVRAQNNLCNSLLVEGRPLEGLRHCESSLRLDPYNSEALYNVALIDIALGRPREAIAAIEPLLVLKAESADVQYAASRAYKLAGDAARAESLRARALQLAPRRAAEFGAPQ